MKNKKLIYILIPLVIIVWAAIIYRVFNTIGSNDNSKMFLVSAIEGEQKKKFMIDTFVLQLNYRDPFLGKRVKQSENNDQVVVPASVSAPKSTVASTSIVWPSITYGGLIKNKNSDKQFVFVQINGQVNIMKAGDVINQIIVTKILKDSIEVQFGKQKKFITQ